MKRIIEESGILLEERVIPRARGFSVKKEDEFRLDQKRNHNTIRPPHHSIDS